MSDKLKIIGYGMIPGILSTIAVQTGLSIIDGTLVVLENLCKVTEGALPFNCIGTLSIVPTIVTIFTLVMILKRAASINDINLGIFKINGFLIGLFLYALGFVIGGFLTLRLYSLI